MAQSSDEWVRFETARDDWQDAVVNLERARIRERDTRWKLNDAAEALEKKLAETGITEGDKPKRPTQMDQFQQHRTESA